MRKFGLGICLVAATALCATAQVTVEVVLEQEQFLPTEPLRIAVRITNLSGQPLHLGETQDWLAISVEARDGFIVPKNAELPVVGPFRLESSQVATKRLNLVPYFDLNRPGRYSIIATVRIADWDREFASKTVSFDIVDGTKLWEREFGVPQPSGPPEVRKYTLQKVTYLKQLKLYARVSDPTDTRVFRVVEIGPMVSFSYPQPCVDKHSKLHVLFQTGARSFLHCVVDPQGEIVTRDTYNYFVSRPRLTVDSDGNVKVIGGVRRTIAPPPTTNAVVTPAQTNSPKPAKP